MDGIEQLMCCSVEGEIKGYKAMSAQLLEASSDRNVNQEAIKDLSQRKQVNLMNTKHNLQKKTSNILQN
jgi:Bardet-Biedl syndrome 2 protein